MLYEGKFLFRVLWLTVNWLGAVDKTTLYSGQWKKTELVLPEPEQCSIFSMGQVNRNNPSKAGTCPHLVLTIMIIWRAEIHWSPILNWQVSMELFQKGMSIVLIEKTWKRRCSACQLVGKIIYKLLEGTKSLSVSVTMLGQRVKKQNKVQGWCSFREAWGEQSSCWELCPIQKFPEIPTVPVLVLFNQRKKKCNSLSSK